MGTYIDNGIWEQGRNSWASFHSLDALLTRHKDASPIRVQTKNARVKVSTVFVREVLNQFEMLCIFQLMC